MILLSEKNTMTFEQFQEQFIDWTINFIEAKRDSGFPICPFARKARLQGKIQFIDARDLSLEKFREFDDTKYEIGIAWIEGNDVDSIPDMLEVMHKENPELLETFDDQCLIWWNKNNLLDIIKEILRLNFDKNLTV